MIYEQENGTVEKHCYIYVHFWKSIFKYKIATLPEQTLLTEQDNYKVYPFGTYTYSGVYRYNLASAC